MIPYKLVLGRSDYLYISKKATAHDLPSVRIFARVQAPNERKDQRGWFWYQLAELPDVDWTGREQTFTWPLSGDVEAIISPMNISADEQEEFSRDHLARMGAEKGRVSFQVRRFGLTLPLSIMDPRVIEGFRTFQALRALAGRDNDVILNF